MTTVGIVVDRFIAVWTMVLLDFFEVVGKGPGILDLYSRQATIAFGSVFKLRPTPKCLFPCPLG